MKIKVIYPNKVAEVDSGELNRLIQKGEIMAFEREHKLAVVGVHPTRTSTAKVYASDRRGGSRTH